MNLLAEEGKMILKGPQRSINFVPRYYQALERWSQFYRHLATLLPWSVYLYTTASLNNYCYFMMYISIKTSMARASVNNIWLIVKRILFNNGMYGDKPSDTDIQQYDGTCPICKVCTMTLCNQIVHSLVSFYRHLFMTLVSLSASMSSVTNEWPGGWRWRPPAQCAGLKCPGRTSRGSMLVLVSIFS